MSYIMQIDILDINEGKKYPIDLSTTGDNWLFGNRHIKFNKDIHLIGSYIYRNNALSITARIMTSVIAECDRCLKPCELLLDIPFKETFKKHNSDDINFSIVDNKVELDNAILESILLHTPSNILCHENCKGICPICGCNKNQKDCNCQDTAEEADNPFAILKNLVGGAKNGSTKK